MELVGESGRMYLSEHAWELLYRLARANDWKPAGTKAPIGYEGEWTVGYFTRESQVVTAEDAREMALALEGRDSRITMQLSRKATRPTE